MYFRASPLTRSSKSAILIVEEATEGCLSISALCSEIANAELDVASFSIYNRFIAVSHLELSFGAKPDILSIEEAVPSRKGIMERLLSSEFGLLLLYFCIYS